MDHKTYKTEQSICSGCLPKSNRHQRKLFIVHDSMPKEIPGGGRSVKIFLGLTHCILVLCMREIIKVNEVRATF